MTVKSSGLFQNTLDFSGVIADFDYCRIRGVFFERGYSSSLQTNGKDRFFRLFPGFIKFLSKKRVDSVMFSLPANLVIMHVFMLTLFVI